MNLTPIINALRKRCPTFERRFAGAAEWAGLTIEHAPAMPAAYVVPLREDASENESQNCYYQTITNTFGVIVLVSNAADVRGQGATATLDSLKPELFRALLSWHQEPKDEYSEIVYEGGSLLYMDDAIAVQIEFVHTGNIGSKCLQFDVQPLVFENKPLLARKELQLAVAGTPPRGLTRAF